MMKKFLLFLLCLIPLLFNTALAGNFCTNSSSCNTYQSQSDEQYGEQEEQVWQGEQDESVYENYGNVDSSSYLNRENIDVYNSDHGGSDFDLSD